MPAAIWLNARHRAPFEALHIPAAGIPLPTCRARHVQDPPTVDSACTNKQPRAAYRRRADRQRVTESGENAR